MSWNLLPLHIFPEGSLSSSVITTVWIGVLLVAFFNLRFGWTLSGLVVPGYLVPLLLIKPWSVAVIIGEGMVTYLLVYGFSTLGARWLGLADFFGRDRFFALVLVSVAVRVLFDALLLPLFGQWLTGLGVAFDYAGNLHSFGLIIVALIANNYWKPGLLRGSYWLAVILLLSFVLVRYGLMELTNFSLSSLNYLYEDIATSILASPKAYIILLTTAWIASRLNLHYAWEFNGILIPSLLALQWYQPFKLLATFAEVGVILLAAHLLLKLPLFANVNLSGARKLVAFFTIGFVYKLLLGHALVWFAPQLKVTDYFAFGYLIATLLAVKIHDKDIGIRVTRATLQTSLTAVLLASMVGFALSQLDEPAPAMPGAGLALPSPEPASASLEQLVLQQHIADYGVIARSSLPQPSALQLSQFQQALQLLRKHRSSRQPLLLQQARQILDGLDYGLEISEGRYLLLRERGVPRGWGTFVIDSQSPGQLLIEVPHTGERRELAAAALALLRSQQAGALALGSLRLQHSFRDAAASDVSRNPGTLFQQFHQLFGPRNVLQLHLLDARSSSGLSLPAAAAPAPDQLWVRHELPADLQLRPLQQALGNLQLHWGTPDLPNLQRERSPGGFAELYLRPESLRQLLVASDAAAQELMPPLQLTRPLRQHLLALQAGAQAALATTRYQPPRLEQLLFIDHELLTPLLTLLDEQHSGEQRSDGQWSAGHLQRLHYLNALAQRLGYQLLQLQDGVHRYLLLQPLPASDAPQWGLFVLRLPAGAGQIIEVPRAGYETSTLELGIELFEQLQARALLVASASPRIDAQGSANVISPQARNSLFNLFNQVLLRESGDAALLVTQLRGIRQEAPAGAGSLLAFADGLQLGGTPSPLRTALQQALTGMNLSPLEVAGQPETAGYEVGGNAQASYLQATHNKAFAVVWVPARTRRAFDAPGDDRQQNLQFQALGIATLNVPLQTHLQSQTLLRQPLPERLLQRLRHYVDTRDVIALRQLQQDYQLLRLLPPESGQALLQVSSPAGVLALINLDPLDRQKLQLPADAAPGPLLRQFLDSRSFLLQFGAVP